MTNLAKRQVGKTAAQVTQFGLGCAPLGDLFEAISEEQAQQTLQAAWDAGVRYFDTAPFYGYGKSEHRVGHFLRQQPRHGDFFGGPVHQGLADGAQSLGKHLLIMMMRHVAGIEMNL